MSEGWIKVYRKLQDCDVWDSNEPFDRRSAWIDLLLMANHRDKTILFNGKDTVIRRGQYLTSVRKLSENFRWSKDRTLKFLRYLVEHHMITKESDNKRTLLTIVNYEIYQGWQDTDKDTNKDADKDTDKDADWYADKDADKDADSPQTIMIKNVKNERSKKETVKEKFSDDQNLQAAFEDFREMRKKIKHPLTGRAITILRNSLNKLSSDPTTQADILDQSTFHGWQGVFPLKDDYVSTRTKPKEEPKEQVMNLWDED